MYVALRFVFCVDAVIIPLSVSRQSIVPSTVRSSASSVKLQYLLVSLRSYNSCLCLLPHLLGIYISCHVTDDEFGEKSVCVLLDGEESELTFVDHPSSEMSVSI